MAAVVKPPFGPIVLTLSGGGFRAAAFHLGTLFYLHRLNILEGVSILSTVSGGTLTGVQYAASLKKGQDFFEFYQQFYSYLEETNLIRLALEKLGQQSDTSSGYLNVITAFARVYDETLTKKETFALFWKRQSIHLKEIIFNATEFKKGIAFRFQKSARRGAKIGNRFIYIPKDQAKKIRLSDIIAASSCFPGGFEPIAFPGDFKWTSKKAFKEVKKLFPDDIALMDGGAYDNQGIESALRAIDRTKTKVGMFFISDVDRPENELYSFPDQDNKGKMTLSSLSYISFLVIGLSLASLGYSISKLALTWTFINNWDRFFYILHTVFSGAILWLVIWLRSSVIGKVLKKVPSVGLKSWHRIKKLTIDQFADMVELRISSLFALSSNVFMKQIRRLIYREVYRHHDFKDKRVSNLIHDLIRKKKKQVAKWLKPSPKIKRITLKAVAMPTTLWFDDPHRLKELCACGQFTTCYNILEHIVRRFGADTKDYPEQIKEMYMKARKDWDQLQQDPYLLL